MSAAAPTPPPHRSPVSSQTSSQNQAANGAAGTGQPRALLHLRDIFTTSENAADPNASLARLLEKAEASLKKARSYLDFRRPDYALLEFLIAANIVTVIIPKHKDVSEIRASHNRLSALYGQCIKGINAEQGTFEGVKELVRSDNEKSGIQPSYVTQMNGVQNSNATPPQPQDARPRSAQLSSKSIGAAGLASQQPNRNSIATPPVNSNTPATQNPKRAPPVQPKPKNLHGAAIPVDGQNGSIKSGGSTLDDLAERFARLRPSARRNSSSSAASSTKPAPNISDAPNGSASRPHVTINSDLPTHLPKQPSPTYSPGRGSQATSVAQAIDSAQGNPLSSNTRPMSLGSNTTGSYASISNGYQSSLTNTPAPNGSNSSGVRNAPPRRRRESHQMPEETQITAERLYDFMRTFNVLLIDVRSREDYDYGHIFSQSVICVEPLALRSGMSAEELVESLCISPDAEPELFDRRDEYDLVVYYDQNTDTTDFMTGKIGSNTSLKYLHDALCDFNQEKPLHRPPILLTGGINAWVELLGPNALQMSNTAASRTAAVKPSRPIARRPPVSSAAKLNVLKRRREYNPLAPEEEQKWRERARSESIVLDSQPHVIQEGEATGSEEQIQDGGNYDDFQNRYPDVATVETRVLSTRPPARPAPEPPRIPSYPELPVPTVPSRPPPALPRTSYSGVSERAPSQSSAMSKSSQLAPYIPPKLQRLPRTGLHNFGVTCYMNSTIQCLSATTPLTAFFFDERFKRFIQQDNWKGSKGLMPELYNILLQNLWRSNDADTIRPTNFRKFCARLNREWGIDRQQDAKEFLEFLIDTLHEDLNIHWARNPLRALDAKEEALRERTPPFYASKLEWERYTHRDLSQLTELFAGQHISRLQCTTCRQSSTTYEAFYSISVEIPSPSSKGHQVDIHDCLRSYCSAERLSKDDYWRCPNCKTYREATKRITITRVPQFLVIHFKRFSASHTERARKVHTQVEFPLHGLDLKPYVLAPPDGPTQEMLANQYGPDSLYAPPNMTPPYKYDAYAVMRHIGGTMTSGHYISLVEDKARGCWREFNDDRVNDFKPEQLAPSRRLQNEQAYIVFYQRVP